MSSPMPGPPSRKSTRQAGHGHRLRITAPSRTYTLEADPTRRPTSPPTSPSYREQQGLRRHHRGDRAHPLADGAVVSGDAVTLTAAPRRSTTRTSAPARPSRSPASPQRRRRGQLHPRHGGDTTADITACTSPARHREQQGLRRHHRGDGAHPLAGRDRQRRRGHAHGGTATLRRQERRHRQDRHPDRRGADRRRRGQLHARHVATTTADITAVHVTGSFTAATRSTTAPPRRPSSPALAGRSSATSSPSPAAPPASTPRTSAPARRSRSRAHADRRRRRQLHPRRGHDDHRRHHCRARHRQLHREQQGLRRHRPARPYSPARPERCVGGDDVTLTGGTRHLRRQERRNGKTVTLTGATLTGTDAGNYALDTVSDDDRRHHGASTSPAASPPRSKVYDGTTARRS